MTKSDKKQCCESTKTTKQILCPLCGEAGRPVDRNTVHFHVSGRYQREIHADDYYFLSNPDCDVVYFTKNGAELIKKHQLRGRVGLKEKEDPVPAKRFT